jgi:hypothetical protein
VIRIIVNPRAADWAEPVLIVSKAHWQAIVAATELAAQHEEQPLRMLEPAPRPSALEGMGAPLLSELAPFKMALGDDGEALDKVLAEFERLRREATQKTENG